MIDLILGYAAALGLVALVMWAQAAGRDAPSPLDQIETPTWTEEEVHTWGPDDDTER